MTPLPPLGAGPGAAKYGDMDLDWFTDVRAFSQGKHSTRLIYRIAKPTWSLMRWFGSIPIGTAWPYDDPTEYAAMMANNDSAAYKDLFNDAFFWTYRSANVCR